MILPTEVWNQVAPGVSDPELRQILSETDPLEMAEALGRWASRRTKKPKLQAALMTVGLLMKTNRALQPLRDQSVEAYWLLPEVNSLLEALQLADAEYRLTRSEAHELLELLENL